MNNPKNHDMLTIVCRKSVKIIFPLRCSRFIFLDETAVEPAFHRMELKHIVIVGANPLNSQQLCQLLYSENLHETPIPIQILLFLAPTGTTDSFQKRFQAKEKLCSDGRGSDVFRISSIMRRYTVTKAGSSMVIASLIDPKKI